MRHCPAIIKLRLQTRNNNNNDTIQNNCRILDELLALSNNQSASLFAADSVPPNVTIIDYRNQAASSGGRNFELPQAPGGSELLFGPGGSGAAVASGASSVQILDIRRSKTDRKRQARSNPNSNNNNNANNIATCDELDNSDVPPPPPTPSDQLGDQAAPLR